MIGIRAMRSGITTALGMMMLLGGIGVSAQTSSPPTPVDPLRRAASAVDYVRKAAAADLYQRQAAQLMLRSTRNPEIRKFAQMMVAEHARTTADMRASTSLRIDPTLSTVEYKQLIGKLTLATGETRDALYLTQQRAVHQRTAMLHEDYAQGGDDPMLKEAAGRIAAIERGHLTAIDAIGKPVESVTAPR